MITCKLMGGLGNQLFQVATTLSVAWEYGDTAVFDLNGHKKNALQGNGARDYRDTIYRHLIDRKIWWSRHRYKEKGHQYQPIPYRENIKLDGYFQSEKYFIKYRDRLLETFSPTDAIRDRIMAEYGDLLSRPNCAIHIRRGDYHKFPKHHPVCSTEYYHRAIASFDRDMIFPIFSDDLDWCKANFTDRRLIFIDRQDEIFDLYLMSMCQHQIIANSSFSWWGSWLNPHPDKRIIAPQTWFGPALKHLNTDDLYTTAMVRI
jgi:hypothetical protein